LQDFSTIAVLILSSYDIELQAFKGGFTDGRYGYFVPNYSATTYMGKVARVDLQNFSTVAVLNLASYDIDLKGFSGGFTDGRYGYFVPYMINSTTYSGKVARVDLQNFSTVAVLNLASYDIDLKGFSGGFTDGRYGYFVPNNNGARFGKVARINLQDFSSVAVVNLASYDIDLKGFIGGFTDGRYGYFAPYSNSTYFGKVPRIDLQDFSTVAVLNLASYDISLRGFIGGFTDGRYGYFAPLNMSAQQGRVARVDLQNFSTVAVLNLTSYDAQLIGFNGGFTDGRYGYFAPYYPNNFGKVVRVQMFFGGNF